MEMNGFKVKFYAWSIGEDYGWIDENEIQGLLKFLGEEKETSVVGGRIIEGTSLEYIPPDVYLDEELGFAGAQDLTKEEKRKLIAVFELTAPDGASGIFILIFKP